MPVDLRVKLKSILDFPAPAAYLIETVEKHKLSNGFPIELWKLVAAEHKAAIAETMEGVGELDSITLRTADDIMQTLEVTMATAMRSGDTAGVCNLAKTAADIAGKARGGGAAELRKRFDEMPEDERLSALKAAAKKMGYKLVEL